MTAPQDEWTDWFQHDGKGCPCVGKMVRTERRDGKVRETIAGAACMAAGIDPNGIGSAWVWTQDDRTYSEVIRFRIRKPRALIDMIQLIADLPAPVKTDGVIA
jgi:hypothetical protein